jgi:hypothetical protein
MSGSLRERTGQEDEDSRRAARAEDVAADRAAMWATVRLRFRAARDIYEGIYVAPYRREIHRQYLRQRDLFLILGMSDMLGIPSPVSFYTLELLPDMIESFHEWHLRLGMEQAPEGGFRCC